MPRRLPLFNTPLVRRIAWYGRQIKDQLNPGTVVRVVLALLFVVGLVALIEMLAERQFSLDDYAESFFWALTSLMGNGDSSFASGPIGGALYVILIAIGLIMAIESIAPDVRTVAEVNNPRHVEHFQRAHADEIVVTPRLASHLVARAALYPGLSTLITDMVSGGAGSELYRVKIPEDYHGLPIDQVSQRLRDEHHATLLAISRLGKTVINPPQDYALMSTDEALVVAEKLGTLKPVHHFTGPIDESRAETPPAGRADASLS